jgi:pyridoxamine 5'-phosphate oxidase family protein
MEGKTETVTFTENELRYLMERKLARIALVSPENEPHIVPVTYEFDGSYFYLSGWNIRYGARFRDTRPNGRVCLLIDDIATANMWVPRGVEVTGDTETFEKGDYVYMRIKPVNKTSWGL